MKKEEERTITKTETTKMTITVRQRIWLIQKREYDRDKKIPDLVSQI